MCAGARGFAPVGVRCKIICRGHLAAVPGAWAKAGLCCLGKSATVACSLGRLAGTAFACGAAGRSSARTPETRGWCAPGNQEGRAICVCLRAALRTCARCEVKRRPSVPLGERNAVGGAGKRTLVGDVVKVVQSRGGRRVVAVCNDWALLCWRALVGGQRLGVCPLSWKSPDGGLRAGKHSDGRFAAEEVAQPALCYPGFGHSKVNTPGHWANIRGH